MRFERPILRRSTDPPPPEDEHAWLFIDQYGDAVSVWIGKLHVQIYRAWMLPHLGWYGRND